MPKRRVALTPKNEREVKRRRYLAEYKSNRRAEQANKNENNAGHTHNNDNEHVRDVDDEHARDIDGNIENENHTEHTENNDDDQINHNIIEQDVQAEEEENMLPTARRNRKTILMLFYPAQPELSTQLNSRKMICNVQNTVVELLLLSVAIAVHYGGI